MARKKIIYILICTFFIIMIFATKKENKKLDIFSGIEIKNLSDTTYTNIDDNDDVLLNPGKGFVLKDDIYNSKYDNLISVGYYRANWSTIEPEKGTYNWEFFDEKINELNRRGKKFALGVISASTSAAKEYVTPKWVFDKGAKYYEHKLNDEITQKIPVWTDEIFLEELNYFIGDFAKKYDGNSNIAFIDIRSYGNWGEQHLGEIGGEDLKPEELQKLYIQPYMDAFKKTLLVNPWGKAEYNEVYKWAIDNGVSIRRDGIFMYSDGSECLMAYGKLPSIFEYTDNYAWMKKNNLWSQEKLMQYIENGKPSYLQFDPEMYEENKEFYMELANKIGYYFKFKQAQYTNSVTIGDENTISLKFINEGVAPLYEDCTVYIGLLDENCNFVKKYKTSIDPHTWMPNQEKDENVNIKFDDIQPGNYILSIGLFLNENDENPTYLLGNEGKTDDKWYVFGKIQINEPEETYQINVNENYFVNSINGYSADVSIKNMKKNSTYVIEKYINNILIENVNITEIDKEYTRSLKFNLEEGKNIIKIVIKKGNDIVLEKEKNLYAYSIEEDINKIKSTTIEIYENFKKEYSNELSKIEEVEGNIDELEEYISQIKTIQDENIAKQKMQQHFELGTQLIQAYKEQKLNIEYVKLSSMLDMLNDIGNSYEDLVTVSAKTRNPDLTATKQTIDTVENKINQNSDIEIIYPAKILKFSQDLYEKSLYISELEEENDIKTGLIVSKDLHAKYLAQWANEFAEIYIDDYINDNPVTVTYSETSITNKDVIATLNKTADVNITNNNNQNTYTFKNNGTFIFEYDRRGRHLKQKVTVTNIDKVVPIIENVENGKVYDNEVIPNITDENLSQIILKVNGEEKSYKLGDKLSEDGYYEIIAIDKAENESKVAFYIMISNTGDYIIKDNKITNIKHETTKLDFMDNFEIKSNFSILRDNKELKDDDIIATGDILNLENGNSYILVVAGDINQDGKITAFDMAIMKKYLLGVRNLDELEELAADVNCDNKKIAAMDYAAMKNIFLGRK